MTIKSTIAQLGDRFGSLRVGKLRQGKRDYDVTVTDEEIFQDLEQHRGNDRLLGHYSVEQVRNALAEHGVWKELAVRGYPSPGLRIRSIDPFRQSVRIFSSEDSVESDQNLLCELRVFDAWLHGPCPVTGDPFEVDALVIDWLLFQNPGAAFSAERPRLPGQRYPGLGIMRTSLRAIIRLAAEMGKEAVVNIPEYYHNAVLYQPAFRFFSPFVEGRFLALLDFLQNMTLAQASHAIALKEIRNSTRQEPFLWKAHEQILGIVPRITGYFESESYRQTANSAREESRFEFNANSQ